jgi:acetylornithine deacetylase/succinyl-diaminopimelate desuccinylase-like protein
MKGAIPGLLMALEKAQGRSINYDITTIITTDEESSQNSQLRYLSHFIQPLKGAYFFIWTQAA